MHVKRGNELAERINDCSACRDGGIDEAIKMVNSTDDGNVSSLDTERGGEPRKCRYEVDAGNIGVTVGVCAPTGFFHFQIPRRYNE